MSRVIKVLTVLAVVALVLFVPLGLIESRQPPHWQVMLGWYLANKGVSVKELHVEAAEAQNLEQFPAQMLQASPTGWAWDGIARIPQPEMVQCVRIERQEPAERETTPPVRSEYLLLGYHDDGQWRAGWLLHRFKASVSAEVQQDLLDKLGCTNWVEIPAQALYQPSVKNFLDVTRTPNALEMFATQIAPTPTPTAVPPRRSVPTAEPAPHKRYFPTYVAPFSAELMAHQLG